MSKDIDHIMKEIVKSNKDLHNVENNLSKDIGEVKKVLKNIENKVKHLEEKIDQAIDILNTFTILISDAEDIEDEDSEDSEDFLDENNEWRPYESPEDYNYDNDEDEDI